MLAGYGFYSRTLSCFFFFFQAEDGIRDIGVTGVQTCALPISDPYALYRQWYEGAEGTRRQIAGQPAMGGDGPDPRELWRRWFDATVESWEKSAELGGEMLGMTPRYLEMLEQARTNLMSAESFPKDPLEFAVQWYNATSGPFSDFVQDVIEREEFLEQGSRWLQSYASFYKVFSRRSEEYLKSLQVPVRSDITRVAGLVVALEDKVDRLEEAFEEFEYGYAKPATAEEVGELEKRLDRVEGKLDRLLAVLDNRSGQNGSPDATDADRKSTRLNSSHANTSYAVFCLQKQLTPAVHHRLDSAPAFRRDRRRVPPVRPRAGARDDPILPRLSRPCRLRRALKRNRLNPIH